MTQTATLDLPPAAEAHKVLPGLTVPMTMNGLPEYPQGLYRLYYIKSGALTAIIDSQSFKFSEGQILAVSPQEILSFEGEAEIISLAFHHHFFCVHIRQDEFFCDAVVFNRSLGHPIISLPDKEQALLGYRFEEIRDIVVSQSSLAQQRAVSTLHSMLLQIAQCKLNDMGTDAKTDEKKAPLSELTLRFLDLLEIHYRLRRNAGFYADALNVTKASLNRRLKKEIDKTTSQAVNERVAIEARKELRSGRQSIKQVAFSLGFEDQLYFSRFFKKQFGVPPSQYFKP